MTKTLENMPCEGFLYARKDYAPRLPYRLVRSDGKIIEEVKGREDVNIGQIAGWPTPEQYEMAAAKALERAAAIRVTNLRRYSSSEDASANAQPNTNLSDAAPAQPQTLSTHE